MPLTKVAFTEDHLLMYSLVWLLMKASDDAFHPKIPKYHFCWGSSKTCIVPLREAVLVLLPLSISEKGKIEAAISWSTVNQGNVVPLLKNASHAPPIALAVLLTCMLVAGKISFSAVQIFRLRNSSGLKLMLGENSFGFFFFFIFPGSFPWSDCLYSYLNTNKVSRELYENWNMRWE